MGPTKSIALIFLGLCASIIHGFVGPSQSTRLVSGSRGPLAATPPRHDDARAALPSPCLPESPPHDATTLTTRRHTLGGAAVPSACALAGLALVGLPAASYALAAADTASGVAPALDALTSSGFYQAFSLVFLSEIGDKTFFVAALLAAKISRVVSFVGSLGALAVMSVISVVIGQVFHAVPAELANGVPLDDVVAVIAFTYFGVKILVEAWQEDAADGPSAMDGELEDAQEAVEERDGIVTASTGAQIASIFALVFAAEFGDRSFLATIALSAAQNPVSVAAGAIAAHGVATGIAVVGGAYISKYVSEKVIAYIGGTLFLIFAVTTAVGIF